MRDNRVCGIDLEAIVDYAEGWWPESGPIDWESLLNRIESAFDIELPETYSAPEIKRVQRAILKARREANA